MLFIWDMIKNFVLSHWKRAAMIAALLALLALPLIFSGSEMVIIDADGRLRGALHEPGITAEQAAEAAALKIGAVDYIAKTAGGEGYSVYRVGRGYEITLALHGVEGLAWVNDSMTVRDILALFNITLGENDRLSHDSGDWVPAGQTLAIDLVERVTRSERETIPFEIVEKPTALLSEGATRHAETGSDGLADRVYEDTYVNGVLNTTALIEETIITPVQNDVTLVGTPGTLGSLIPEDDPIIPDGLEIVDNVPSSYQSVIEGANCTAYTSNYINAYGAAGIGLVQGCVAVNPAVIPYGSLLYITDSDGGYVYGFAIAADTGTAMLGGFADIDCYFDTYRESALFGRRYLNVYVIAQLDQTALAGYCSVTTSGAALFRSRVPE